MASADNLDYFLNSIGTQDTHKRMQLHEELIIYLHSSNNPNLLSCDDFEKFLDGISAWIVASNYKVSLNGLEVLSCMIDKMQGNFQALLPTFLPLLVDRLADNKEQVRSSAQGILLKITTTSPSPQSVFERLSYTFKHKSPRVREEMLVLIQNTLKQLDSARNVGVSKLVPHIVKLLEDPCIPIREVALETLAVMYAFVGERLKQDVLKRDLHPSKLNSLMVKFQEVDEVTRSSSSLHDAASSSGSGGMKKMEEDLSSTSSLGESVASSTNNNNNNKLNNNNNNNFKRSNSTSAKLGPPSTRKFSTPNLGRKLSLGSGASGPIGVDEESFSKQFVLQPKINIYSGRELVERVTKVKEVLVDSNADWNKRIDALREIRAWFSMTSFDMRANLELFLPNLVTFEPLLQSALKDLRSQVVREACITVAFLSQELQRDFFHFSEMVLPFLIPILLNSAKVMASSAYVTIKFLIQNVQNPKLIPIITSNLSSKSNVIRRHSMEFVNQVLQAWAPGDMERQLPVLLEAVKKGVSDADAEARLNSRRAFWSLSENFKTQADGLLHSLDSSKQRQLIGEQHGSSSSSLADLTDVKTPPTNGASNAAPSLVKTPRRNSGTLTNKDRVTSSASNRRKPAKDKIDGSHASSDLDLTSLTNQMSRVGIGANNNINNNRSQQALYGTLPRSRKSQVKKPSSNLPTPTSSGYGSSINSSLIDRSRSKNKVGVSQSQPSSRSNSPAPRLSYLTPIQQPDVVPSFGSYQRTRRKSSTALNKSRESSRDPSPIRGFASSGRRVGSSIVKSRSRNLMRSTMGEDFMLSRLKSSTSACDSDDVNSETSSVCSDNSAYWNCGRQITEDPAEMISLLASGSWSERRDGLYALQHMLNNNRTLSRTELKKVTDLFSRMFHDPHGKVFSVFMETLTLVVVSHHADISSWLYVLLTRLLAKTGADLLGSTQLKLQRALDAVRSSFPTDQQFLLLSKFLIDQTQSPNLKVKASMLLYLHGLTELMSPEDFVNSSDVRLALSRIITWTTEPKSVDVRKAAQAALLSLHALNPTQFTTIMAVLPKTFQEGAERILQTRQQHSTHSSHSSSVKDSSSPASSSSGAHLAYNYRPGQPPATAAGATSDDIYHSFRQTSEDIHNLVQRQQPLFADFRIPDLSRSSADAGRSSEIPIRSLSLSSGRVLPTTLAVESRIPSFLQNLPDSDIMARMTAGRDKKCNGAIQTWFGVSNIIKSEREEAEKSATVLSVPSILQELSHHNERNEERRTCLLQLMKKAREEEAVTWDEYFNTVLLILLETFTDTDSSIRALSLRVLSEFLRCHAERFQEYVELTVVRSLEAHKDPVKEVTRAAEECSSLLSRIIQPEKCHVILGPLIESDDFPINLASVKMMHQMVEESAKEVVVKLLPSIAPTLLKAYENNQSSVRKSSVVCLVAMYMVVGEELRPYLGDLHGSKIKLLNVYIKRAVEQQGGSSCATSKTSSPTSVVEAQ